MKKKLGFSLLLLIFNILVLSSIGFILKFNIIKLSFIYSLLITLFEIIIYTIVKNKPIKEGFVLIGEVLFITLISIVISSNFYDYSWDGNSYHKAAIGAIKEGWNPVYEDIKDFSDRTGKKLEERNQLWDNHYAKGYWIYSASTYSLTNNIESGKSLYLLIGISTFLLTLELLETLIKNKKLAIISALLLSFNPVFICQMFTFYNDALIGNLMLLEMISFTYLTINKEKNMYENLFLITMILSIIINIKFTGLLYAGIYAFIYYIYILISKTYTKKIVYSLTVTGIISIIIGVLLIGSTSYVRNYVDHKNPFYPLIGDNKVDIMSYNRPTKFNELGYVKKFLYANFLKTNNDHYENSKYEYDKKIPLTFSYDELGHYVNPDVRIGGYGVLFGGILIISFVYGVYVLFKLIKSKSLNILYLLPIIGTILCMACTAECWWARYFPQLYFMTFIPILLNELLKHKKNNFYISKTLLLLLFINSFMIFEVVFSSNLNVTKSTNQVLNQIAENDNKVYVMRQTFDGSRYIFIDKKIENKVNYIEATNEIKNINQYEYQIILNGRVIIYQKSV